MFKCLLLVHVLLARELYSWEFPFHENQLLHSFRSFANGSINSPDNNFLSYDFVQNLDHFNPTDSKKWIQKIYYSSEFYRPGGPTFVMISHHMLMSPYLKSNRSAWLEYAKLFGAHCILVEMRYMGGDWPTSDLSTENLKYLSSQQAIADVAEVIDSIPYSANTTAKHIVFGFGRGGSLAAWLRLKYPHLVSGAVASSAPLDFGVNYPGDILTNEAVSSIDKLFKSIFRLDSYRTAVKLLSNHSKECVNSVRDAFKDLNIQLEDKNTQEQIKKLFKLCPTRYQPEVTPSDITLLNMHLASLVSIYVIQSKAPACTIMTNETLGTPLQRLATLSAVFHSYTNCIRYKYDEIKHFNLNVNWISRYPASRQYWYEKCTEFGLFETSDDPTNVFGSWPSLYFYQKLCTDLFGPEHDLSALAYTTASGLRNYGGLHIDVTNIVFVDGSKNLFLSQGIVKNVNSKSPAIIINGELPFADVRAFTENDSSELKEARAKIVANIKSWLKK